MTMEAANIALVQAFQATTVANLPTRYEGLTFAPPADGAWIELANLPADCSVATLGDSGEDRYSGIFQIDYNAQPDAGAGAFADFCQEIRDQFRAGTRLIYGGQSVRIIKAVPSGIRDTINGGNVQSMSIYWDARIPRSS